MQRYVSNELTHFVGRSLKTKEEQYRLLTHILVSRELTIPNSATGVIMGNPNANISENDMYWAVMVCFCDIPIADLGLHMAKYSGFGLSFKKSLLVARGANPVFYIEKNSQVTRPLGHSATDARISRAPAFDDLIKLYHDYFERQLASLRRRLDENPDSSDDVWLWNKSLIVRAFLDRYVLSFLKFFDSTILDDDKDNFYMEREWRILDNLTFELSDVYRVILPSGYASRLRADVPNYCGQVTFSD